MKESHENIYKEPLKFLFFYKYFARADNKGYDLIGLKESKLGSVFSIVYGNYTKRAIALTVSHIAHTKNKSFVDSMASE